MVAPAIVCYSAAVIVGSSTSRTAPLRRHLMGVAAMMGLLWAAPASGSAPDAATPAQEAPEPVVRVSHGGAAVEVPLRDLGGIEERAGAAVTAVHWDRPKLFAACEALAAGLDLAPPFEGDIDTEGDVAVPVLPEAGEAVDCAALALLVEQSLAAPERGADPPLSVEAPIVPAEPPVSAAALEALAAEVDLLLKSAVTVEVVSGGRTTGKLTLEPDDVRAALRVVVRGTPPRPVAELRPDLLERPGQRGLRIDGAALFAAAGAAAKKADHKSTVAAAPSEAAKKAEALFQKGLVASYTTKYPKGQPRVTNIHRIVKLLDGAVVEPGERFSLNQRAGKRTVKRGFVLAPSIGEGTIVETVGGGVSQVATTLYNAVFDAGYAVVSRKPHTRYFDRYPLGVEATLAWPRPDFVFRNDSKTGVLIRASVTEDSVTVKLYGDTEGRKVKRAVSKAFDSTDPRTDYEPDEAMSLEKTRVKDAGTKGFSVKAGRDIVFADGTKKHEERTVVYHGRPRVVVAHPCAIPKGEKGHRKKRCPKPTERVDGDALYESLSAEKVERGESKKGAAGAAEKAEKGAAKKDAAKKGAAKKDTGATGGEGARGKGGTGDRSGAKDSAAGSKAVAAKDKPPKK